MLIMRSEMNIMELIEVNEKDGDNESWWLIL